MKLIRNIYLLLTLALTAQVNSAFSMNIATIIAKAGISGICSLTELFVTSIPTVGTILDKPRAKPLEKLTDTQSVPSQIVADYLGKIAKERGAHDIKLIIDSTCDSYANDKYDPIVYINPNTAHELESLLKNNARQPVEEEKLNLHTGDFHHELTHELRDSGHRFGIYRAIAGTVSAVATSSILSHVIKKNVPIIPNSFILNNGFKITRSGFTFLLASHLIRSKRTFLDNLLYVHYEETQSDKGIPNQKELLEPQAKLYEARHADRLEYIQDIKTNKHYSDIISLPKESHYNRFELLTMKTIPIDWFNNPHIMSNTLYAQDTHPSDIQRALHFRKRIKDIDATAPIKQN